MPTRDQRPRSTMRPRRAVGVALVAFCGALLASCSNAQPSGGAAADGLIALIAGKDATSLVGWDGAAGAPLPIKLPTGEVTWIAPGRADVLVAVLADGKTATSDPVHLGKSLAWRPVKALGQSGHPLKGPDVFATWDPAGGRFATLAGDLDSGDGVRVVVVDPSAGTALEIPLDRAVVPAPPVWIDADRFLLVTGDAADPLSVIVDTKTGGLDDGPANARLLATAANGRRIATMGAEGDPVVVRDTTGWLTGDGSSIASIDPPNGSTTAIGFALDATGERLVVAWAARDGTVSLAVHDGTLGWRRVAQPDIGKARGAVVAFRR
jgi:hypothetical protein